MHLAHAFVQKDLPLEERIREAFGEMGVSVLSGMVTSVLAAIPLFSCTVTFFAKFAVPILTSRSRGSTPTSCS